MKAFVRTDGVPDIPDGWVRLTGNEETKPGDKFYYPPSGNWVDYWFSPTGNRITSLKTVQQFGWISIRRSNKEVRVSE